MLRTWLFVAIVSAGLLSAQLVSATDAYKLRKVCSEASRQDRVTGGYAGYPSGYCIGYIVAIVDMFENSVCWPRETVKNGQLVDVVIKWLNDHPESLHLPASHAITKAMQQAFPCPAPTTR